MDTVGLIVSAGNLAQLGTAAFKLELQRALHLVQLLDLSRGALRFLPLSVNLLLVCLCKGIISGFEVGIHTSLSLLFFRVDGERSILNVMCCYSLVKEFFGLEGLPQVIVIIVRPPHVIRGVFALIIQREVGISQAFLVLMATTKVMLTLHGHRCFALFSQLLPLGFHMCTRS